jgi:hypothetical protein
VINLPRLFCAAISSAPLWCFPDSLSADALDHWTTNQVSTNRFGLQHVVYGNGRFVAGGGWSDWGALLSSEDGLKWTLRVSGNSNGTPQGVTYLNFAGDRFLITAGPFGYTAGVSTNGIDWSFGNAPFSGNLRAISYGAGRYVLTYDAYSMNSNNFYYSNNGTSWTPAFKIPEEARDVLDVAFGANKFVAVANGGFAYTSSDGVVWERGPIAGGSSIAFEAGRFFVPLSAGTNLVSANGINWAAVGTGLTNALGKIALANGVFFARAGNYLATSTDGTNWTQRTSSTLPGNGGLASDGRIFVNVDRVPSGSPYYNWHSFVHVSDPFAEISITNSPSHQILLSGLVGRSYRIEYVPVLPSGVTNPWQTLTNLTLPSSPYLLADPQAPNSMQRYYRAVLLP